MDKLIRVVADLQTVYRKIGVTRNFDLPQIVVVGSQSSGKSSTLEALVGREFLPRGENICTRRPLQLELIHVDETEVPGNKREWAVFPGDPPDYPKNFTNFHDVCNEIEYQTETKAEGKTISEEPIILKVFSPDVCTLTLIDLPGLTEVAVQNQPEDIPEQIERLVMKYITPPRSIILAVHPANVDAATCVALKIAKRVDPRGDRTVAVITKLDRVQSSPENVLPLLTGKLYDQPLLGIVGIYNRTPMDQSDFTNKQAKEREVKFLNSHFPSEVASANGVDYLASKLSKILINHIVEYLPDIKLDLDNELIRQKEMLESLGDSLGYGENEAGTQLTSILDAYTKKIANFVDGTHDQPIDDRLIGGARIKEIFTDDLAQEVADVDPVIMMKERVKVVIENAIGVNAAIFAPDGAFQMLVRQYIMKLFGPSVMTVEQVHAEMVFIAEMAWKSLLLCARFPKLKTQVMSGTSDFLRDSLEQTKKQIEILLNKEMAYINTNHRNILSYMKKHENPKIDEAPLPNVNVTTNQPLKSSSQTDLPAASALSPRNVSPTPSLLNFNVGKQKKDKDKQDKKKHKGLFGDWKHERHMMYTENERALQPRKEIDDKLSLKNTKIERRMITDPDFLIEMLNTYYYEVVMTNILDLVPKTIMLDLVYHTTGPKFTSSTRFGSAKAGPGSPKHLFEYLNTLLQPQAISLLAESEDIAAKRSAGEEAIKMLKETMEYLDKIAVDN